ncbi:MAG: proton-conducting transporter membrane subunit [bacterium]
MEYNNLLLLILIPLVAGLLNIFLPRMITKLTTFISLGFNVYILYLLYKGGTASFSFFDTLILSFTEMGFFALIFIQLLSFIIMIFSLKGIEKSIEKNYFILYPLTLAFCNGVALSNHVFSFLIFWGLSGLTLYLFCLLGKTQDTPKTAKKTFIIIGGSDALLIMGFVIMWFLKNNSSWSIYDLKIPLDTLASYVALIFMLIAAFAKAGGFPFHTWVPDFSKDAPIESAAFLPASLDKLLGIYLLTLMVTVLFEIELVINMIIITFGALTVITAVMMAMNQHNGKKLLGYHAVSQVGYMIMGIGSGSALAFAGGLFHLVNHTIYKSNLFLTLGSVEKQSGTAELDNLGGLGKKMPITFVMALIGALSISGIPPFNGFFSKWMIYQGLIEKTAQLQPVYQLWLLVCIVLAVFGSALTLASFMKFLHAIYLGRRPEIYNNIKEAPANQWLATSALSFLCIVFGILAIRLPLSKIIFPAVESVGIIVPEFIGLYIPWIIVSLFLIGFVVGMIIYLFTKKVRYDAVYLGGSEPLEKFRVAGTEFYNEIRNMKPLKTIYDWAEKKYFDVYEMGSKSTFALSRVLQKGHPGQLQLYILYIIIGLLIFMALV